MDYAEAIDYMNQRQYKIPNGNSWVPTGNPGIPAGNLSNIRTVCGEGSPQPEIRMGLSRIRNLCGLLGNPQDKLRIIHVAGTNGKGSVAAYISSILGVNGVYTGRFVSPAVFRYEETVLFEDAKGVSCISRELFAEAVTDVAEAVGEMKRRGLGELTKFEKETAVALLAFQKRQCQAVILEAGMGGGEDATNITGDALATVITPIGMDHMEYLGNSIREIAREKAGIIKPGRPVISFQTEPDAVEVLESVCRGRGCRLTLIRPEEIEILAAEPGRCLFSYRGGRFQTRMAGSFQAENACLAIEACRELADVFPLDEVQLMLGVREAYWRGRFEVVCPEPLVIVDGAHNESGVRALVDSMRMTFPGKGIHGVMGVFRDKDYASMIKLMKPELLDIVAVTAGTGRGLPAQELAGSCQDAGIKDVRVAESVPAGLGMAIERCGKEECVLLFGSLSLLHELKWKAE